MKEKEFNDKKEVAPTRLLEISEYRKRNFSSENFSWWLCIRAEIMPLTDQLHTCHHNHAFIYV